MPKSNITSAVHRLRDWIVGDVFPLWASAGVDPGRKTFVERLTMRGEPILDIPRRAMVQARQIYVFSQAALLGLWPTGRDLALNAAERLIDDYHGVDGAPGWVFSIHPTGRVSEGKRDLYSHSFVLFGLAWAYKLAPNPRFLDASLATLEFLDLDFSAPYGGYYTTLPVMPGQRLQNPHMHLLEAMLAWSDATGDPRFLARAGELYSMMASRFFQPSSGILAEYFDDTWTPKHDKEGRICEPGHHYEWFWLLRAYASRAGKANEPVSQSLKMFADKYGYDDSGLIVDELLDDGSIQKSSRRCWPHTEAIKAEVAAFEQGDVNAPERAACIITKLFDVFLGRPVPGGWIDHVDTEGKPLVDFMPASTLYHLFLSMTEANRVWGES